MRYRSHSDDVVHRPDVAAVTGHVVVPAFAVGDIRWIEAIRLLDACRTLHREGILEDDEYEAKRVELADGLALAERGGRW